LKLIFSEIKNRLSKKFKQWNDQCNTPKDKTIMKINYRFFIISFISFLSEKKIKKFFKTDSLYIVYKRINNFRGFIRDHKDVRPKLSRTDVIKIKLIVEIVKHYMWTKQVDV